MIVEGPQSFSVFIGQDRTAVGMVMGLVKDPDADDDLSASDTVTILPGGGSVGLPLRHADRRHAAHAAGAARLQARLAVRGQLGGLRAGRPEADVRAGALDSRHCSFTAARRSGSTWTASSAGVGHDIISPVLPVQGEGVHIRRRPGPYADTLRGRLDELRIWKHDPHHHTKQFFCRPMSLETEACWRRALARASRRSPPTPRPGRGCWACSICGMRR